MKYLYFIILSFSFFTSLIVCFRKSQPLYVRLFPLFLLITLVANVLAYFVAIKIKTNHPVYNVYNVVEFAFYFFVLHQIVRNKISKRVVLIVGCIYIFAELINILVDGIKVFHSSMYLIGSVLIVLCCFFYFFELIKSAGELSPIHYPEFWMACGLLALFGIALPVFGVTNFAQKIPSSLLKILGKYLFVVNYVEYLLFSISFLVRNKMLNKGNAVACV